MRSSFSEMFSEWAVKGFLWGLRIVIVLLLVVGTITSLRAGKYTTAQWVDFFVFGVSQGSIYAVIALGYTMVYGILRMINFAHGDIFMTGAFGGYFAMIAMNKSGFLESNPFLAIVVAMLVAAIVALSIGLLTERVAYRPLRGAPRLVPLISAIGASFFIEYSFRGFFGPGVYAYPAVPALQGEWNFFGFGILKTQVVAAVAALIMMVGLYLFVMRSKMGKAMRAVSESKDVAALMGIDVNRMIVLTFGVGAALAGAAGVLYGLIFIQVQYLTGFVPGIKAFTAAVLGGIGNIPGAMVGGLVLGIFESLGPALFLEGLGIPRPYQLKDVIAFTMLVMILLFRPSGILGERITTKKA